MAHIIRKPGMMFLRRSISRKPAYQDNERIWPTVPVPTRATFPVLHGQDAAAALGRLS